MSVKPLFEDGSVMPAESVDELASLCSAGVITRNTAVAVWAAMVEDPDTILTGADVAVAVSENWCDKPQAWALLGLGTKGELPEC